MDGIMTPNGIIKELQVRFKLTIIELRKGLQDHEVELYCNVLGITETTLFWAIRDYKCRKELKKQKQSTSKIYPTKEKNRGLKKAPACKL